MNFDDMQSEAIEWAKTYQRDIRQRGVHSDYPSLHSAHLIKGLITGIVVAALTKKEYLLPASIISYIALEASTTASLVPLSMMDKPYQEQEWDVVGKDEASGSILMLPTPATWARYKRKGFLGWWAMYLGNDGYDNTLIGLRPDLYKKDNWYMENLPGTILHEVIHHKQLYTKFNPYMSWDFKAYQPYIEFEAKVIGYEQKAASLGPRYARKFGLEENWNSSNLTKPQLRALFGYWYGKSALYNMDMKRKEKVVDWFHNKYYGKDRKLIPANYDAAVWRFDP